MNEKINKKEINIELDHVAYAVKSTDKAIEAFSTMYSIVPIYKCLEKNQNVFITYLSNENESYKIELVEPAASPNPIENMLKSKDVVLYHLCYRVKDFKKAISYFKKKGFFMITAPFKISTEKSVWACHFFNPQCGIIEIMGKYKNE